MAHVEHEVASILQDLESELEQFERDAFAVGLPDDLECELLMMRSELAQLRELAK